MKTWKSSIFSRLLVTFIAIMIPIYLLGLFIYNWGINAVRDELESSTASQVSVYLNNLTAEIGRIQTSQRDALGDENLYTLAAISASMNEYERSKAILRLQQRLNAIRNSSEYIHNVIAYIPPIGKSVSALDIQEEITEEIRHMAEAPENLHSKFNYMNGKLYLILKYPVSTQFKKSAFISYAIIIELSEAGFRKALGQLTLGNDRILLIDRDLHFTFTGNENREIDDRIREIVLERKADEMDDSFSARLDGQHYMVIAKKSEALNVILTKYVPEDEIFSKVNTYRQWFWLYTVITVAIITIFSLSTYKFIHKPIVKLVKSFKKIELGDLNIRIMHSEDNEFRYLFQRFNIMVEHLNELIDQAYKQKILAQTAELKQLQSQINPHFLYNSFFILHGMVESEDYDALRLFTKQLGSYFQFITRSSANDIPLQQEVVHAQIYAEIQAKRFRNRIKVQFQQLPEAFHQLGVPRLILQPLLENAFGHGLEDKVADGLLRVSFHAVHSMLYIVVEDNGDQLTDDRLASLTALMTHPIEGSERTGVLNIHHRLQLKFGVNSGMEASRSALGGLQMTIRIELGEEQNNVPAIDRG